MKNACDCGSVLFSASPVFQAFEDGRVFELADATGACKNVWTMRCLGCGQQYIMGSKPYKQGGLLPLGSPEANAMLEEFSTDGVFTPKDAIDVPGHS